jgi:hypothetical protein
MDTFAIATDRNTAPEITESFIVSPEVGQTTREDLSRVEARASWSPRACVAFSTLSLLASLKEMLSWIVLWPKDNATIKNPDAYRSRRPAP